jgi:hypothetical protein
VGAAFLLVTFLWLRKEKLLPCRGHIPASGLGSKNGFKNESNRTELDDQALNPKAQMAPTKI